MITGRSLPPLAIETRNGSFSTDLENVIITPPGGPGISLIAPVEFGVEGDSFQCRIRLAQGFSIPPELSSFFDQRHNEPVTFGTEECFSISGNTPDGVVAVLEHVSPIPGRTLTAFGANSTYHYRFSRIQLAPRGLDRLTESEIHRILRDLNPPAAEPLATEQPVGTFREHALVIVPGVELLIRPQAIITTIAHPILPESTSTDSCCFCHELLGGEFCLEAKDGDILVFYKRETMQVEERAIPISQLIHGLLEALRFTHACLPAVFYSEQRENYRVLEQWVLPIQECNRDSLTPIVKSRMHFSNDAQNLFVAAARYFSQQTEETEVASRALWLINEASRPGMPYEIRLITLCSVFEGMIHRLAARLLSEEEIQLPRRQKWPLMIGRLNLPWEPVFERVYESWDYYRHPLAHGFQEHTDETPVDAFVAYSRLTAAIYILLAKDIGFVGHLERSVMEDLTTVDIR